MFLYRTLGLFIAPYRFHLKPYEYLLNLPPQKIYSTKDDSAMEAKKPQSGAILMCVL